MNVVEYITEEVRRQGHDVKALGGLERVGWMLDAWLYALRTPFWALSLDTVALLGSMVEPQKNLRSTGSFRRCEMRVGSVLVPTRVADVPSAIKRLLELEPHMTPLEFYEEFEFIHPFVDGNGRVGKVLMNWKAYTLLTPTFPPDDLWGESVVNP
jgi:hypothetical protein